MSEQIFSFDRVLCQLTSSEFDLFQLRCIRGETYASIATARNCLPETVLEECRQLRAKLQSLLLQPGHGPEEAIDRLYRTLTERP